MKLTIRLTIILFLSAIILPFLSLSTENRTKNNDSSVQTINEDESVSNKEITSVSLLLTSSNTKQKLKIKDYLFGVVSAEMPASFSKEALKAQVVASYTYLKWLSENSDSKQKDSVEISDNSTEHQAYLSENQLKEKWGDSYDIYYQKINEAIDEVLGEYLAYNNETAMTVFHSNSKGTTNSAESLWETPIPYLVEVNAPGDKLTYDFTDSYEFTTNEFLNKISDYNNSFNFKSTQDFIASSKTDDDGYFINCSAENNTLMSTDIRVIFDLKSNNIKISPDKNSVTLTTYGKGHGVGMSQNSADFLARQGKSYKEILEHFYKGAELIKEQ